MLSGVAVTHILGLKPPLRLHDRPGTIIKAGIIVPMDVEIWLRSVLYARFRLRLLMLRIGLVDLRFLIGLV
jgi:hypothetical protein